MPVVSSAGCGACEAGSNRRGPIPACTLHLVRRRQIATEGRRPIDPLDRVLEVAETRVGVRPVEGERP